MLFIAAPSDILTVERSTSFCELGEGNLFLDPIWIERQDLLQALGDTSITRTPG